LGVSVALTAIILSGENDMLVKLIIVVILSSVYGLAVSMDNHVLEGQKALQAIGYSIGKADGIIGPKTINAIRNFQENKNIPITGRFDALTMQALGVGSPNKNILSTKGGEYEMKLGSKLLPDRFDPRLARLDGRGKVFIKGDQLVSSGTVKGISEFHIEISLYKAVDKFSIDNETKVCNSTGSKQISDIKLDNPVTIYSDSGNRKAISIYLGQFYIVMDPDNPAYMDLAKENYPCN
jgi:peptidoglycan hydrolase-like protein with peptidoglycan-binding domain